MAAVPAVVVIAAVVIVSTTVAAVSRAAMTVVPTAAIVPIPLVTAPIAAAIVVSISIPTDHDARLHIDRSRLIDDRRRRWRVIRLRRHVDGRRNPDVDPQPHLSVRDAG